MTRASAGIRTEPAAWPGGGVRSRISVLRSDWPLMLRTTSPLSSGPLTEWACRDATAVSVHLAAGAAGPLGGDRLSLRVDVAAGSSLMLGEIAPTLLLPGPHGEESRLDVRVRIGSGGTLVWQPELVIAAHRCRHQTVVQISLEPGARLVLREETLFGRYGEQPGRLRQRLRVVSGGRPLHDQELHVGPSAPGWDGPAVTGGHRTAGTLLIVDPDTHATAYPGGAADSAVMPLDGHGVLVSALAPDTTALRRRLDAALADVLSGPSAHQETGDHQDVRVAVAR